METASYFTYRGPGRIGISVGNPRGIPGGFRTYKALAPDRSLLHLEQDEYRKRFLREVLAPLNPNQVVNDLRKLAGNFEPVLLCFEKPPFTATNWCHRRMVAEWLLETLGLDVPEHQPAVKENRTRSLFD